MTIRKKIHKKCLILEFIGEAPSRQVINSIGLKHSVSGDVVSISSSSTQNRYRIQCSEALALPLVLEQLFSRIADKSNKASEKLSTTLAQQHFQLLQDKIDSHFETRLRMKAALVSF